jgi:signal transduction histidine kinase
MTPALEAGAAVVADDVERRNRFRETIRRTTVAIVLFYLCVLALQALGQLRVPTGRLTLAVAALLAAIPWQARLVRTAARPQRLVLGFHLANIAGATVINHWLGGIRFPAGAFFYGLVVSNSAYEGRASWLFANVSGAAYALLLGLEHAGVLAPYDAGVPGFAVPAALQVSFAATTWAALNLVAAYTQWTVQRLEASRRRLADANAELDGYRRSLEALVGERTRALEAANRELAATAAALRERSERLRTFVYTVTHDLKNPVNAVLLTADLLLEREGATLSPEGRADLERIARVAGATEDMIRDLLGLFRITSEPEARSRVELDALVARALDELAPRIAAKRARVTVATLPALQGQREKLGHVVTNLLDNAVKYLPAGRGTIAVDARVADGWIALRVRDDGIGIPPEYHRGIFEPYGRVPEAEQRVDGRSVAGSGIGLAIVGRIVADHGGRVEVDSAPGRGSTFTVWLPVGDADASLADTPARVAPAPPPAAA